MFEIVTRTVKGRRLFRPVEALTRAVFDVLGRSATLFAVQLHAFIYLSNHMHLLATFLEGLQMRAFMTHLNRNTALVAKQITGWSGDVWERYQPTPVLDNAASVGRLQYILANGVKEGLVEHPLDWPGPSSARALATGEPIETSWLLPTPRGPDAVSPNIERNRIELTPLPIWARVSREVRCAQIRAIMDDAADDARAKRGGKPVLGVARLRSLDPFEPTPLDETPPPVAHASDFRLIAAYKEELKLFARAHRRAGASQRETLETATYPPNCFPAALPFHGDEDPH